MSIGREVEFERDCLEFVGMDCNPATTGIVTHGEAGVCFLVGWWMRSSVREEGRHGGLRHV